MSSRVSSTDSNSDSTTLAKVIARLSSRLDPDRIGSGAYAELRRIAGDALPPQFWYVYLAEVPRDWREPDGKIDARHDWAWAGLMRAMVGMGPQSHGFGLDFGKALADTGYSEARFVRLLRAGNENLARELRVAGQWLARAGVRRVNWVQPAGLFRWGPGRSAHTSGTRHRIARDYFRAVANQ